MFWVLLSLYLIPGIYLIGYAIKHKTVEGDSVFFLSLFMLLTLLIAFPALAFFVFCEGYSNGYQVWTGEKEFKTSKTGGKSYEDQLLRDNRELQLRIDYKNEEINRLHNHIGVLNSELQQFKETDPIEQMKKEIGL